VSLTRLIKWIGLVALVVGIIGFLFPGTFIYSPQIDSSLTRFGDVLFKGISSNPTITMLIAKAPVIGLALIGFVMVFWATIRELTEPKETMPAKPQDAGRQIKELIASQSAEGKIDPKSPKWLNEPADRRKP